MAEHPRRGLEASGTSGMKILPKGWIARMKASMRILTPIFSTNRMLAEYDDLPVIPNGRARAASLPRKAAPSHGRHAGVTPRP
jgi:glucan phosphorylase